MDQNPNAPQKNPGSFHGPGYGLDSDVARKLASKLDPKLEAEAKEYMKQWTGVEVRDIHKDLMSGIYLCKYVNIVVPFFAAIIL